MEVINWHKNENFHKENFDSFVREVAHRPKRIQTKQRTVLDIAQSGRGECSHTPRTIRHAKRVHHVMKHEQDHSEHAIAPRRLPADRIENDKTVKKSRPNVFQVPLRLKPKFREQGSRHHLSKFKISDKKTRDMFLARYRKNKKARYDEQKTIGIIEQITCVPTSTCASIFKIQFARGTIKVELLADGEQLLTSYYDGCSK